MRNDSEAKVETHLIKRVAALGGIALKLYAVWYFGIPDRIVFLPGGRLLILELKRPSGGRRGVKQKWWIEQFQKLGFTAGFANTIEKVNDYLEAP